VSPLWLFHHGPAHTAVAFARATNDLVADWCSAQPDRLKGLAQLPAQDVTAAVVELNRGVTELGLLGGYLGTDARPALDDPALDPLYQACVDLDVPLFLHSTIPGIDGPAGDPRLQRWLGQVTIGYPIEETVAVTSLLLGGVPRRHPRLDLCVSHGGAALPFLYRRLRAFAATPASPISPEELDESYAQLWFDTHVHSAASRDLQAAVTNPAHLVGGNNFGGWDSKARQPAPKGRKPTTTPAPCCA